MKRLLIILLYLYLCATTQAQYTGVKPMLGKRLNRSHHLGDFIGCWLMNEGSGNQVQDSSGNGNTGTFGGSPTWKPGNYGPSIYFNEATPDYISLPKNSYELGIRRHATYCVWVEGLGTTGADCIFSDWDANKGIAIRFKDADSLEVFVYPNDHRITVDGVVSPAKYFICVVLDGANMHLYLDGIYLDSEILGEDIGNSAENLVIGRRGDTANPILGTVEMASIYNRALTAKEVTELWIDQFCMFKEDLPISMMYDYAAAPPTGSQVIMISGIPIILIGCAVYTLRRAA